MKVFVAGATGALGQHLSAEGTNKQDNASSLEIIDEIERGVLQHRTALRDL